MKGMPTLKGGGIIALCIGWREGCLCYSSLAYHELLSTVRLYSLKGVVLFHYTCQGGGVSLIQIAL